MKMKHLLFVLTSICMLSVPSFAMAATHHCNSKMACANHANCCNEKTHCACIENCKCPGCGCPDSKAS